MWGICCWYDCVWNLWEPGANPIKNLVVLYSVVSSDSEAFSVLLTCPVSSDRVVVSIGMTNMTLWHTTCIITCIIIISQKYQN